VKFLLFRRSVQSLGWVPTAGQQDGAFISIVSFASSDREAVPFDLTCRSSEQFLHFDQPEAVQNGDVSPIGTWLANLANPEEDSFGAFYLDGDTSSGDSRSSPTSDAFLNQLPARPMAGVASIKMFKPNIRLIYCLTQRRTAYPRPISIN
jgi:hypothetical protein